MLEIQTCYFIDKHGFIPVRFTTPFRLDLALFNRQIFKTVAYFEIAFFPAFSALKD